MRKHIVADNMPQRLHRAMSPKLMLVLVAMGRRSEAIDRTISVGVSVW